MSDKDKIDKTDINSNTENASGTSFLKVRGVFWVGIAILVLLLLLSIVALSARIVDYAQADRRALSVRSNMDSELDIFSVRYKNAQGEITVEGLGGDKVIAPGTDVEYTIRIRNADRIALDYTLTADAKTHGEHPLPLEVRVLDPEDKYLLGSPTEWASIDSLRDLEHEGTLSRGEALEYTFRWRWSYEGDDEYDTMLGNLEDGAGIEVSFALSAVANTTTAANGGFFASGLARSILLLIFAILLLIAITLLIISIIKRNANPPVVPEQPEELIPEPEPTIEPEPVIEPEPTPIPTPEPPKKQVGFNGKMAYINLDIICEHFGAGEVVSLPILKKMGLIPEGAKQMKVLARNGYKLEYPLIIETQGISAEARRVVLEAGGVIIIADGTRGTEIE